MKINNRLGILKKEDLINVINVYDNVKSNVITIIYMKNNKIINHELLRFENLLKSKNTSLMKIIKRMYELNANKYYLLKNNKSGEIDFLDIVLGDTMLKNIKGFQGYFIIGEQYYSFLVKDNCKLVINKKRDINVHLGINIYKESKNNSLMKMEINYPSDLIKKDYELNRNYNYSFFIFTDKSNQVKFVQKIINDFILISFININNYLENIKSKSKTEKVYVLTRNKLFYERALELKKEKYINDCIAYEFLKNKTKILEE